MHKVGQVAAFFGLMNRVCSAGVPNMDENDIFISIQIPLGPHLCQSNLMLSVADCMKKRLDKDCCLLKICKRCENKSSPRE